MLPILKKTTTQQFQASQIKLYHPPRQLNNNQIQNQRKTSFVSSSRGNSKIRVKAGGFKRDQPAYDTANNKLAGQQRSSQQQNYATLNQQQFANQRSIAFAKLNSNKDLSAQIKLIEKKIRYHKKKLQDEKKRKQQIQRAKDDPYSNDFEKIIRQEMELQGYSKEEIEPKGFDYLTNPGKVNQEEQPQPQVQQQEVIIVPQPKRFDISEKVQKLQKHYENNLKKKFQRRQMFPHYQCKRKTPKLYVTAKHNAIEKYGKKPAQQEHMFRVMTRECTPQQIYPTIPNFPIVKDNLSKNVLAYLTDFKPFIDKTKEDDEEDHSGKEEGNERRNQNPSRQENRQEGKTVQENRN